MFDAIDRLQREIDNMHSFGWASYSSGTWTPTCTGMTVVGGPPVYTGFWYQIGHLVFTRIVLNPNGGTMASTLGVTWIDNLPFSVAMNIYGIGIVLNESSLLPVGTAVFMGSTFQLYLPTWAATADYLCVQGWTEI